MIDRCELGAGGGLRPTASAQLSNGKVTDEALRWVRMISPQAHEIETAISTLELSNEGLELLQEVEHSSQVVTHGTGLVMTLPVADLGKELAWVLGHFWYFFRWGWFK